MLHETSNQFVRAIRLERGEIWPCGHERTEENTQAIGKAGVRCKLCRRAIARRYYQRHRDKVRLRQMPSLIETAEHRLKVLRNEAAKLNAERGCV